MNRPSQLTQMAPQIWGAKQSTTKLTSLLLPKRERPLSAISNTIIINVLGSLSQPSKASVVFSRAEGKIDEESLLLKKRALALVHRDRSIPTDLYLRKGAVKELDDGVFAKRRRDGILEIYVSEE